MAKTKAAPKSEKRVRMSTRRSANFTHHEKLVLLSLMREYRHIVEDRHTDGVTVREKNTAWVDLTNTYNAESDVSTRSLKQLRQCWKNLKSRSRIDFLQDETGNADMGTLTLLPATGTTTSQKNDSTGSGNTLTLVTVGGISNPTTTNEGAKSSPSNNPSSIDNASTIILNNILTNNNPVINNNNSNSVNSIPATNGITSENMSSSSASPGLTNFSQALPIATSTATNRQGPESKTSSSNKKRKKKAPANPKAAVPTTAVAVDAEESEPQEVSRQRRKARPTLVHLDYNENGVLEGDAKTAETERPRRKTRPSVMHLDYDISTVDDDEDDDDGAVVADEDVSDRLHVNVAYPDNTPMVVSQSGQSQDADDGYPSDTLAVVSVSGSADRIHFNSHVSTPDSDHIQPHEVNLHPQPQTTTYRLTHPNTTSTNHNHPIQIQPASFQPSSNHLQPDEHTTGEHDIKVFDSIRGFGKVLHTQNALPTHLVSHVTDGHTVHSVNIGPSINYSGSVDIINNVPPSHPAPHIVPAHGANSSHIPSIEPVLLEKVPNNEEPSTVDFHKTEHSERMRNIRLERRLIAVEHKARMELIKLKSEYIKMKMEVLIQDRS